MTLSDLERRKIRGVNFLADFHNYAYTFDLVTEFGTVIGEVEAYF